METSFIITFTILFTLLFFLVGSIIGWLFYRHLLESRVPYLHPEFFDQNGNVIPDEILAVSFDSEFEEDDDEEEDKD